MVSEQNQRKQVKKWLERIEKSEKEFEEYHKLISEIRDYYKNKKRKDKQNIFWSGVETLKPFIYFKQPKPYIERKDRKADSIANTACRILEKALVWDLQQFDFDSVIKYARNDFLLSGLGVAWEQYVPEFVPVQNEDGTIVEVKASEQVNTVYVDPLKFLTDVENVGIWEEVTWIARIIDMTRREAADAFDVKTEIFTGGIVEKDDEKKNVKIYEIWDKNNRKVYWLAKEVKDRFLRINEDVLGADGFFPCPKPIFATTTNDSLIPVPDYTEIKAQLDELDGINSRMKLTMQALKVSGAYDNSFPELANILSKDVTLVSLKDFQRLKDAGGIRGVIDFVPVEQYISTLTTLAERRQDLTAQIYEITGVSDIMRGNSDPAETATAVNQKTNFGTLRNQDRQNDMQRFLCDLFKIKAEIICEQFSAERLLQFADDNVKEEDLSAAVKLLKHDKLRGMTLGVETDTAFNQTAEAQKTFEAVKSINDMIQTAFPVISQQPFLLPLYRQMIESVTAILPSARQFENVLEQAFAQIESQLSQPQPEQPNPEMLKIQTAQQKNQQEFEVKQRQTAVKEGELRLKREVETTKAALTEKEMDLQAALRAQEIRQRGETNTNIPTGFVGSFE